MRFIEIPALITEDIEDPSIVEITEPITVSISGTTMTIDGGSKVSGEASVTLTGDVTVNAFTLQNVKQPSIHKISVKTGRKGNFTYVPNITVTASSVSTTTKTGSDFEILLITTTGGETYVDFDMADYVSPALYTSNALTGFDISELTSTYGATAKLYKPDGTLLTTVTSATTGNGVNFGYTESTPGDVTYTLEVEDDLGRTSRYDLPRKWISYAMETNSTPGFEKLELAGNEYTSTTIVPSISPSSKAKVFRTNNHGYMGINFKIQGRNSTNDAWTDIANADEDDEVLAFGDYLYHRVWVKPTAKATTTVSSSNVVTLTLSNLTEENVTTSFTGADPFDINESTNTYVFEETTKIGTFPFTVTLGTETYTNAVTATTEGTAYDYVTLAFANPTLSLTTSNVTISSAKLYRDDVLFHTYGTESNVVLRSDQTGTYQAIVNDVYYSNRITPDFTTTRSVSAPQLVFDGYNKLHLSNSTPTSTTLGLPDGTTRDLTTQSNVYIYETGTYTANVQTSSDTFAYLSNVVTSQPSQNSADVGPTFTFDGYNRLNLSNLTQTSSTLKYGSKTYDTNTASNVYVTDTGEYILEAKDANTFVMSNVYVGAVSQHPSDVVPTLTFDGYNKLTIENDGNGDTGMKNVTISGGPWNTLTFKPDDNAQKGKFQWDLWSSTANYQIGNKHNLEYVPGYGWYVLNQDGTGFGDVTPTSATSGTYLDGNGVSQTFSTNLASSSGGVLSIAHTAGTMTVNESDFFEGGIFPPKVGSLESVTIKKDGVAFATTTSNTVYIRDTGTYTAEVKGSNAYAIELSNVVSGSVNSQRNATYKDFIYKITRTTSTWDNFDRTHNPPLVMSLTTTMHSTLVTLGYTEGFYSSAWYILESDTHDFAAYRHGNSVVHTNWGTDGTATVVDGTDTAYFTRTIPSTVVDVSGTYKVFSGALLTFDGYNKITVTGTNYEDTATVTYYSNAYNLGTAKTMYVKDTGEYVFKISGTDKYVESNVYVSSVDLAGAPTKPIDFDGYNKLTLIDAGSNVSANVTYFSNTYELGSANVLYINGAGTYDLEMSGSNVFALSSNIVGAVSTGVIANPVFTSTTAITTDTNWTSGSGWEVTADSTNNSTDRPGWKAFDNTWTDSESLNVWHSGGTATSTSSPTWLKIKYPSAYKAVQYSIQIRDLNYPRYPKTWKFQGSNNDSDWTDLDTQTNKTDWAGNNTVMFTFSNSTAYQYYRVYITATDTSDSDGGCCIRELKVYTLATGSQVGNVPLPDYTYPNTITVDSALSGTSIIIANDSHQVSGGKWYTLNHSTYIGNRFIFWDNAIGYWSYFDTQGNRPDSSWDNPGGPPGRFFMETDGDLKLFHGSNGSTIMHIKPNSSSNPWPRISAPSLTFDGYNKLTLENFTTTESDTRTAKLTDPNGSTYALGQTQDAIYIKDQGDYFLEVTNSDQSAVVKTTVGTVTSPPTYQYIGFGGMTDLSGSYTTTNTYLIKLTKADGTPLLYSDIETSTILMDNGNGTNIDFTHIFEETKEPYAAAVGATTTTWHGDSQIEVTALADGTALSDHATNTYIAFYFKLNEPTTIIDGANLTVHRNDKEQWKNAKAFGTNTDPSTFSSPHTPTDWTELVEVTTVDGPLGSYNGGSNPSEPWTSLGATQDFNASAPGRHLSLNFDTYNKLTFTGADTGSTYKLKYESNTYDLGTISNVYIAYPGTYSAEIKGATNFALTKNVVGALDSDSDSVSFTIFPSSISLGGHWQNNYGPATYTKTSHTITQIVYDLTGSAILSALGGSTTAHGIKFNATSSGIELDVENADDDNTPHTFTSTTITTATSSGIVTVGQSISLKAANGNEEATFTVPYFGYIIGSPTFLNFDGYNKLSIQNITPTSTTLKYFSNTYEIGTVTNIYVENTGDYSAEIGNATDFALTSNVVSSVAQIEPGFASRYQGSMALTYDGKLYAWGMNDDGEAGVGTSSDITVPTLCTGITQGTVAKLLSSSDLTDNSRGEVSAIKTTDGKIYMAGKGDNNCIPGKTSDQTSFTDVTSYFGDQSLTANTVTMMSFTDRSGAALTETGNVWTWGTHDSTNKALGQASASSSSTPKQINFSSVTGTITKITCGVGHSLALDTSGDVWFWGKNTMNSTSWPSSVTDEPQKVVDGKNIIGLASSHGTMYAWDATGKMWNAGNNWEGQIGDGTTTANSSGKTLTEVTYFSSNGITINKVYAGGYSVFADTSDGYYCWGNGSYGVFGNGSTGNITSGPAKWTNVTNIKKFMASTEHTTAITEDGKYYAWGRGTSYERGDNDTGDITYPKYISQLPNILAHSFEFDGYDKVFVNDPTIVGYRFGQVGHVLINIGGP